MSNPIIDSYDQEVRPFIDLIDQFRNFGIQNDIELPQICVMGDQSSGKSSVLQAISGVPFPRGSGLVTRCPTQLIMKKAPPGSSWTAHASVNWSKAQPDGAGEVCSIDELSETISKLTNVLTDGKLNGFSTDSIVIKISSPESPDLTIIDLPGIVRTATSGQDAAVIMQVNNLINYYMSQPRTIILAVIPANQDIATIDILERAAIVDPMGARTIGVLTKPDLIGPGSEDEVVQVLRNVRKPLALGYIMVKNPSQKEVNECISQLAAKESEMSFFQNHPQFSQLQKGLFGTQNLVNSLTKVLVANIKMSLPDIKTQLERQLEEATAELYELGKGVPVDSRDQQALVMDKVTEFCRQMRLSCRGDYREGLLALLPETRLHVQMQGSYGSLQQHVGSMRPGVNVTEKGRMGEQLLKDMDAYRGRELSVFLNSQVLYASIIALVEAWRPHMENCKAEIIQYTRTVAGTLAAAINSRFPALCAAITTIVSSIIDSLSDEVGTKLEALLEREQDPFTAQDVLLNVVNRIRFRAFDGELKQILDSIDKAAVGEDVNELKEQVFVKLGKWYKQRHGVDSKGHVEEMVTLIQAYWDVASRRFVDNVCMCLETELTSKFMSELETQCFLYGISLDSEATVAVLSESAETAGKRDSCAQRVDRLGKANQTLREMAPEVMSAPVPSPSRVGHGGGGAGSGSGGMAGGSQGVMTQMGSAFQSAVASVVGGGGKGV